MRHATGGDLAARPGDGPPAGPGSSPAGAGPAGAGPATTPATDAGAAAGPVGPGADGVVTAATALLATPGLVVIHGGPGCGRSTLLGRLGAAFRGPVFAGGALASLRSAPAIALARAVRARLPDQDPALLAEAVRSRVRGGLLLVDDLQWADPATVAALVALAPHCRLAVALRTPHRLPDAAIRSLRAAAAGWFGVPPLDSQAATALVASLAPDLDPPVAAEVVRRAGGVPLALTALARHAADGRGSGRTGGLRDSDQVEYAVAVALADLSRPARTAMAALGLLGRPAHEGLLGAGVAELTAAALVTTAPGPDRPEVPASDGPEASAGRVVTAVSPYVAEVAAGLLDDDGRRALHRRLAELLPPAEAVRHLAAAGDVTEAYPAAVAAAERATTTGARADLLLLACGLPGAQPPPQVRIAAAGAALASGRPRSAARVLTGVAGEPAAVLRGEALLQAGDLTGARDAVATVADTAADEHLAGRDRIRLLAALADGPHPAAATTAAVTARHGPTPGHPGLRAALAAVAAAGRAPGWEYALASAAEAAGRADEPLTARWSAWLLVETLAADGRLAEAGRTAESAARACAADRAYSWQVRFLAVSLWCAALRGADPDPAAADDAGDLLRRAGDLTDRTLPALARGYAVATVSLVEADGGLLAAARARLGTAVTGSPTVDAVLDWVSREAAWLDGQPEHAVGPNDTGPPLVDGLRRITARWATHDGAAARPDSPDLVAGPVRPPLPVPVRDTLAAWTAPHGGGFVTAAAGWRGVAVREEVRCLLAGGLREPDRNQAVPPLLAAEELAERAGLVVLLGRTRRALRQHAVRRDGAAARTGGELTGRERDVLRLVAAGEPSRRIASQLGISGETVETHVRSGMRKLGARTRTEAAALVLAGPA